MWLPYWFFSKACPCGGIELDPLFSCEVVRVNSLGRYDSQPKMDPSDMLECKQGAPSCPLGDSPGAPMVGVWS